MKPWLNKSASELRSVINYCFPDRDKRSDGWIGDARHQASKSDHNPDPKTGCVRAIDIDSDLGGPKNTASYLAEQLRVYAKADKKKRISYIIFNKQICSPILGWKWRKYTGIDPHTNHLHISFNASSDNDSGIFESIPLLAMNGKQ